MRFPEYTNDTYWTDVIEQYILNDNKHPGWYNIEYYMWECFKYSLKLVYLSEVNYVYGRCK